MPEMNILPLTSRDSIVVIANTSDQRVPNRRLATINYDGVMPQSIYYAAHRMPPRMIPTCLHGRALRRRWCTYPEVSARAPATRARRCMRKRATCEHTAQARRCVRPDKLAALNLMSFISGRRSHRATLDAKRFTRRKGDRAARASGCVKPIRRNQRSTIAVIWVTPCRSLILAALVVSDRCACIRCNQIWRYPIEK